MNDTNEVYILQLAVKQAECDLEKIREETVIKRKKLNAFVTIEEHEQTNFEYTKVLRQYENNTKEFDKLSQKYLFIQNRFLKNLDERNSLIQRLTTLKRSRTPRPDWNYFSQHIKNWKNLYKSLTSDQKVDIVLNEFIGGNSLTNSTHFLQDLGYLKAEAFCKDLKVNYEIKNKKLSDRDYFVIVREILGKKIIHDKVRSKRGLEKDSAKQFMLLFFEARHKTKRKESIEWSLSILHMSRQLSHINEYNLIYLFANILTENTDEDVYYGLLRKVSELRQNSDCLVISIDVLRNSLQSIFHYMSIKDINDLVDSIKLDSSYNEQNQVDISCVYDHQNQLNCGHFIRKLREIFETHRLDYCQKLCKFVINAKIKQRNKEIELKIDKIKNFLSSKFLKRRRSVHLPKLYVVTESMIDTFIQSLTHNNKHSTSFLNVKVGLVSLEEAIKSFDSNITDAEAKNYVTWVFNKNELRKISISLVFVKLNKTFAVWH